jgi:hypothetical protein
MKRVVSYFIGNQKIIKVVDLNLINMIPADIFDQVVDLVDVTLVNFRITSGSIDTHYFA